MSAAASFYGYYRLPEPCVIEVLGNDAGRIVNNLCTNDINRLEIGKHFETFITNVRGWVVAHGFLLKQQLRIVFVGQHPDPQVVVDHIDKYIIREDAEVKNLSEECDVAVASAAWLKNEKRGDQPLMDLIVRDDDVLSIGSPMISSDSVLLAATPTSFESLGWYDLPQASVDGFELTRIRGFWPRVGREILDKCIPQELDRDELAISFTKGCYLGQETIARLDARGQLQKKLCLLEIHGPHVEVAATLTNTAGKIVGTISSQAADPGGQRSLALAMLKRGDFEAGTELECDGFKARVLPKPNWLKLS